MADPTDSGGLAGTSILTQPGLGAGARCFLRSRKASGRRQLAPSPEPLLVGRIVADHPFSNAGRLLRAFALDGDVPGDLDRAAADLVEAAGDDARADPGSGRHR